MWDVRTGRNQLVHYEGTSPPAERGVHMAGSHDGHHFYFPCGNVLKVYETHWGRHVRTLKGHFAAVNCVVASTRTAELYRCVRARSAASIEGNYQRRCCHCERRLSQPGKTAVIATPPFSVVTFRRVWTCA